MGEEGRVALETPRFVLRSARGQLRIFLPAPTVMIFKYVGHTDLSHIEFIERAFDDTFAPEQQHLHLFVDAEEQTGYDSDFRRRTAAWSSRVEPRTDTYCVLVKSRLVAIGVNLTVLAVGGRVSVVSKRAHFEARLESAIEASLDAQSSEQGPRVRSSQ
jgi:hypothetical protein